MPFFAGLNRLMYYTLCRVAERAGVARKEPRQLITDPDSWHEFSAAAVDVKVKPGQSIAKIEKFLFKVCRELVKKRYAQKDKTRYATSQQPRNSVKGHFLILTACRLIAYPSEERIRTSDLPSLMFPSYVREVLKCDERARVMSVKFITLASLPELCPSSL